MQHGAELFSAMLLSKDYGGSEIISGTTLSIAVVLRSQMIFKLYDT